MKNRVKSLLVFVILLIAVVALMRCIIPPDYPILSWEQAGEVMIVAIIGAIGSFFTQKTLEKHLEEKKN